ncbi:MAG TPA: hypothetical protein DCS93_15525 [Microscillaceae bacterium]|nr:hypothetical protein [Microscillaceae bacterium]
MKNQNQKNEKPTYQGAYELLLASFDRELTEAETAMLEQGLADFAELRAEKADLEKLRTLVGEQTHAFKPFFAGRVMHKIENLQQRSKEKGLTGWMVRIFPKVAVSGLAVIILLMASTYLVEGSFSLDTLLGISEVAAEDADYYLIENF